MATNLSTPSRNTRQSTLRRRRSLAAVVTGASLMLGSGFAGLIPGFSSGAIASTVVNGRAFLDLNADGYQILTPGVPATDEVGLAGVTVTVTALNGGSQVATTNAIGDWTMTVAAAGPYRVEYSNIPTKLSDGRGIGSGMKTQFVDGGPANLAAFGKVDNFGAITDILDGDLTAIGNRIWDDINSNGVQDAGEPGIPNVVVTISSTSGPLVTSAGCNGTDAPGVATTATTDSSGQYEFRCLESGKSFVLSIDKSQLGAGGSLAGFFPTVVGVGGIELDSNGTDSSTAVIAAGTTKPGVDNTYDFGFKKGGGVDPSTTTTTSPTSSTTSTIPVTTTTPPDTTTPASTTTTTTTTTTTPASTTTTTPASTTTTTTTTTTMQTSTTTTTDVPVRASIGDTVWLDTNGNNVQDSDDIPIPVATVRLLDSNGNAAVDASGVSVPSQVTGVDGKYLFTNLVAGTYTVRVTRPAGSGYVAVTPKVGVPSLDSDGLSTDVVGQYGSGDYTLVAGQKQLTVDFGFKVVIPDSTTTTSTSTTTTTAAPGRAAIGDTVFFDVNGNNVFDAGDTFVRGALVELLNASGGVVDTFVTAADGKYSFTNLAPGNYQVRVTRPVGTSIVPVTPNVGDDDAIDSDGNGTGATVVSGFIPLGPAKTNNTVDFGWKTAPTVPTVTTTTVAPAVTTTTAAPATTTTTTSVVVVPAKASIGDRLFIDANKNGIQDANETGIPGAKVTVYRADGTRVTEVTTGADGRWIVDTLDAGSYYPVYTLPNGYDWTTSKVGNDDGLDSDVDINGRTRTITVTAGQRVDSLDAGVVAKNNGKGAFGDRLFIDANGNGKQDPSESGISGATVSIYRADGTKVADVTTGADGRWIIDTLEPGSYYAIYPLPTGYAFTTRAAAGVDDELNSDADTTGRTQTITLKAGDDNRSLDAGLVAVANSVTLTGKVFTGKPGDTDGPAVPNISVTLTLPDAKTVTATTDANGKYIFSALAPGEYTVKVALPAGAVVIHAPVTAALTDTAKVGVAKDNVKDVNFGYELPKKSTTNVLPSTEVKVDPAPAQPGVVPVYTGSDTTHRGFQGAGLLLMGLGLAGLLRSRKEQYKL